MNGISFDEQALVSAKMHHNSSLRFAINRDDAASGYVILG